MKGLNYKGIKSIQLAAVVRPLPRRAKVHNRPGAGVCDEKIFSPKFLVEQYSYEKTRQTEINNYLKKIDKYQLLLTQNFLSFMKTELSKKQMKNFAQLTWQNLIENFSNFFELEGSEKAKAIEAVKGLQVTNDKNRLLEQLNSIIANNEKIQEKVNAKIEAEKAAKKQAKKQAKAKAKATKAVTETFDISENEFNEILANKAALLAYLKEQKAKEIATTGKNESEKPIKIYL